MGILARPDIMGILTCPDIITSQDFGVGLGDFHKLKLPGDALKESRPRGDVLKEPPDGDVLKEPPEGDRKFTVGAQGLRPCHW